MSLHQLGGPILPRTLIPSTASGVSTDKTAANSQVPRCPLTVERLGSGGLGLGGSQFEIKEVDPAGTW